MSRVLRFIVIAPCPVLHRLWWVPIWNRSAFLSCPASWACNRWDWFRRWYWEEDDWFRRWYWEEDDDRD
jgi:hypothetical protein